MDKLLTRTKKQFICNRFLPGALKFITDGVSNTNFAQLARDFLPVEDEGNSDIPIRCGIGLVDENLPIILSFLSSHKSVQMLILISEKRINQKELYSQIESYGLRLLCDNHEASIFWKELGNFQSDKKYTLIRNDLNQNLHKSRRRLESVPPGSSVNLGWIEPSELLHAQRFDIAIKALYARLHINNLSPKWADHIYYEHLLRITGPGKIIAEFDGSGKEGYEQYKKDFDRLLQSTEPEDIPPVPFDNNRLIFDGAHRVAAAIVMKRPLYAAKIDTNSPNLFSAPYHFFSGTVHKHPPCAPDILDDAAIEYCRDKPNIAMALIFPVVTEPLKAFEILKELGPIVYKKSCVFTPEMGWSLLHQAYSGHDWLNFEANVEGFTNKVKSCFPISGVLHAVLIDLAHPEQVRTVKQKIRSLYGIGNNSIHISDSDDETLRIAKVVYNKNSLQALNAIVRPCPGFSEMLGRFEDWIIRNDLDPNLFAVSGSAILGLFGLREPKDLDFIYAGPKGVLPDLPKGISCHNDQSQFYCESFEEIIGNPHLHFWYMGIKFCSIEQILNMKLKRNEEKDQNDASLISKLIFKRSIYNIYPDILIYFTIQVRMKVYRTLRKYGGIVKRACKSLIKSKTPF